MQLTNIFPAWKETQIKISFLILGTFLGAVVGSLTKTHIDFPSLSRPIQTFGWILYGAFMNYGRAADFLNDILGHLASDDPKRKPIE